MKPNNFYIFYTEYYPTPQLPADSAATALFRYAIKTGFEPSDSSAEVMVVYKNEAGSGGPITGLFDLNKLTSGNYHLEVAHINKQKQSNPYNYSPFINRNFRLMWPILEITIPKSTTLLWQSLIQLPTFESTMPGPQLPTEEAASLSYAPHRKRV